MCICAVTVLGLQCNSTPQKLVNISPAVWPPGEKEPHRFCGKRLVVTMGPENKILCRQCPSGAAETGCMWPSHSSALSKQGCSIIGGSCWIGAEQHSQVGGTVSLQGACSNEPSSFTGRPPGKEPAFRVGSFPICVISYT